MFQSPNPSLIDAPQIFTLVGAGQNTLLITGFFGVVKVVSCLFFLLFLVERIGRRGSLLLGAFLMGAYMLIVAVLTVVFPPNPAAGLTPPAIASLTMIYLEAMSYNISWGPVPWVYMGEIFPMRIRESGIAIGTSTQWLFNFVFSQVTPHAVKNLGWKTFVMFCVFNWALVVYVWLFIKETKGKSLEDMEERESNVIRSMICVMLTCSQSLPPPKSGGLVREPCMPSRALCLATRIRRLRWRMRLFRLSRRRIEKRGTLSCT